MRDSFDITSKTQNRLLVSIILPAYNEASILKQNLHVLYDYLMSLESQYTWEIMIVNDGSSDDTGDIAEEFKKTHTNVTVLHHMYNYRLGQALRFAFNKSRGDYVIVIDVDLSYSPDHIEKMLHRIEQTRAKIVIASPYAENGKVSNVPWSRKVLSKYANKFLSFVSTRDSFSDKLTTFTGMVRAYDGNFIRNLNLKAMDVDILPEIIYKAMILRARIVEIPAHLNWKTGNKPTEPVAQNRKSSLRIFRSILQSTLSGFMFRPFMFFIAPGVLLFLLSLYPISWAFVHSISFYQKHIEPSVQSHYRFSEAIASAFQLSPHSFIIGGLSLIVGIQLISLGMQALQQKRYYEELFHLSSRILKKQ